MATVFLDSSQDSLAVRLSCALLNVQGLKVVDLNKEKANLQHKPPVLEINGQQDDQPLVAILTNLAKLDQAAFDSLAANKADEIQSWSTYAKTELSEAVASGEKKRLLPCLHKLNKKLESIVFLASNRFSLADIILFAAVQPIVATWKEDETFTFDNISRWYDNIQHIKQLHPVLEQLGLAIVFKRNPPKPTKEKEQPHQSTQPQPSSQTQPQPSSHSQPQAQSTQPQPSNAEKGQKKQEGQQQEKGKKENEKKPKQPPASAKASKPEVFGRLDIRVGKIIKVQQHPNANALYQEEIDLGEDKPRTVVSGLVQHIPLEEMQNRMVICLCNLKPANMRGVRSEAMVICAATEDHSHVELVDPPVGSAPGEKVTVEGEDYVPDEVINLSDKNNIFKKLQQHLKTNDARVASFQGKPLQTAKGHFTVKTLADKTLS